MVWQNKGRKFFDVELEVGYDMPGQGDVEIQRMGQHFDKSSIALAAAAAAAVLPWFQFLKVCSLCNMHLFWIYSYEKIIDRYKYQRRFILHTQKKRRKEKRMQGGKLGKEGRQKGGSSNKNKQSQKVKHHCHFNWPDLLRNNEVLKVLESPGYYAIEAFPPERKSQTNLKSIAEPWTMGGLGTLIPAQSKIQV